MSNEKMHIESNTVQETLVIPLWGRKILFGDLSGNLSGSDGEEDHGKSWIMIFPRLRQRKIIRCSALVIWKRLQDIQILEQR